MPPIVETADTLGGEPRIEGTRIGVLDIAELVLDAGYTPADTADQLLSVAAVYTALAYYHELQWRPESFVETATIQKQPSHRKLSSRQHAYSDSILH